MKLFPSLSAFLRRWSFAVAALATLVAAFYVIENWRGERAWTAAMERLRAAGEPVTLEEWLPKPPPDDQNFMLNPVFVRRHGFGQKTPAKPERWDYPPTYAKAEDGSLLPFPYQALGNSDGSWKTDMVAIAAFLPEPLRPTAAATQQQAAQAVLEWIRQWEPDFAVLMEAARTRPANQIPWSPESDLATRWDSMGGWLDMVKVLQLRALAQVTAGDGKGAFDSLRLMHHLGRAVTAEPAFLINLVLSTASIALGFAPLNHGLASEIWTEEELAHLEHLLRQIDVRSDLRRAWRGERFYFSRSVEEVVSDEGKVIARVRPQLPGSALTLFPRGWWLQNQARAVDLQLEQEQRLRVPAGLRPRLTTGPAPSPTNPYRLLFSLFAKRTSGVENAIDEIEARFILARLAVALERYRLAHGSYPQALDELATFFPGGQPSDPFSGKPPGYALVAGRPRLSSIGSNRRDDREAKDPKEAEDIVWVYPAE